MTDTQLITRYKGLLHALCIHHSLLKEQIQHSTEYAEAQFPGPRRERLITAAETWRDARKGKLWIIKRFQEDLFHFFGTDIPEEIAKLPLAESLDPDLDHGGLPAIERIPPTKLGVHKNTEPKAQNWRMSQLGM
jgi:hypothetical protein